MCIFEACSKKSYFNYEGETKALYCGEHRLDNMVDIKHPKCIYDGCKKHPSQNFIGEKKPLYCVVHRIENMENVITPRCLYPCNTFASYNIEGQRTPIRCYEHREDNMINIISINKKCKHPGCKVIANYNYENETKRLYCSTHKKENMAMITNNYCIFDGCRITANYNYENEKRPMYCSSHKKDGMKDVKSKICKTYLCSTMVKTSRYDGYCLFCFMNLFPDKPVSRNYKTKEYSVVEYVKTNFSHLTWISDKTIQDGCSRRRPDLFLDMGYQIIIIEIDENSHRDYDCSCENKRIMELSQDLNHRPIIFIRFNPDEYTIQDNKISSCWGINKNGICTIKKSKIKEWTDRLESLKEQIHYWTNTLNKTDKTIEVVQLFYDV
jgi:hypothetical protein